ncbi:MAG: FAD-binding domain-containing protein [Betaproteobacteria bacterium]
MLESWMSSREAAIAQLDRVDPAAYARSRNFLDGAVTGLSPWITHGMLDLPEVLARLRQRHCLGPEDKLVCELGWREFFHHVWRHLGEGILADVRPPLPGVAYARAMPPDLLRACTGVPVVDASVRQLYQTGWLHNHQRLWLASYAVHVRKVHWRSAADWMVGHLLDGDLGSNHLSWQWCAGTFSSKPYLFNAGNVARYAPALASPGTFVDCSYEALDRHARHGGDAGPNSMPPAPVDVPELHALPPRPLPPAPEPAALAGQRVHLMHPWGLRRPEGADTVIGVLHQPFHARFPWSARRWDFVLEALARESDGVWLGDVTQLLLALAGACAISARATLHSGYRECLAAPAVRLVPVPRISADPDRLYASFTAFWKCVSGSVAE